MIQTKKTYSSPTIEEILVDVCTMAALSSQEPPIGILSKSVKPDIQEPTEKIYSSKTYFDE